MQPLSCHHAQDSFARDWIPIEEIGTKPAMKKVAIFIPGILGSTLRIPGAPPTEIWSKEASKIYDSVVTISNLFAIREPLRNPSRYWTRYLLGVAFIRKGSTPTSFN